MKSFLCVQTTQTPHIDI